jgi:hypothetical protein
MKAANATGLFHFAIPTLPTWANGPVFAIVAQSTNPFESVPIVGDTMTKVMPHGDFALAGMVDSQKNWGVHVSATNASFFSLNPDSLIIEASSVLNTVHFQATIRPGFGLFNTAQGDVDLNTGRVLMTDSTGFSFDITVPGLKLFTVKGSETLTLFYSGGLFGQFSAGLQIGASAAIPFGSADFSAHADVTIGSSYVIASGGGELDVYGREIAGVSIDNKKVSVTVAGQPSTFNWPSGPPGALSSDGPAKVGTPTTVHFFVPDGVADPVHFSAALSADGLAANYDAAGTNPDISFTFGAPGTYTIYGRMYLASGETDDYSTTVPVFGPDQADTYFVERLYHDLLGRSSDSAGLAFYTGALANGATHEKVAGWFLHSDEYQQDVVQAAYHEMLGRFAEPAGLRGWISFLQAGHTADDLRSQIAKSPEYAQVHLDDAGLIQGLYQDALGRMGTTTEVDYYTQVLAGGASRADVVQAFFASSEHQTRMTQETYEKFLRRDADASGLFFYSQALGQGKSEVDLVGSILGSTEYAPRP